MLKEAFAALRTSERPVLVYGAGVRLAHAGDEARQLARILGIPVAPTWGARDLFPEDSAVLCAGGFGTHGTRAANFAVQNADWILAVGTRLDSKATGTPRSYFARGARIFMVDIDPAEIAKFKNDLGRDFQGAQADAHLFLTDAIKIAQTEGPWPNFCPWRGRIYGWKARYPVVPSEPPRLASVNPYVLVRELSEICEPGEVIVSDTGLSLAWMMQAFMFKYEQTFVHAFNQTPMGYGLPAAIGAAFTYPKRVILINGDGGFMLNIQELPLLVKHQLPIKILLFNNGGHAMCRQTQEQWLGGKYYSTSLEHGLAMPDFVAVAKAYGLAAFRIERNADIVPVLATALTGRDPVLIDIVIDGTQRLIPQVPYGTPNEDGSPKLPRDELREQMIVDLVK